MLSLVLMGDVGNSDRSGWNDFDVNLNDMDYHLQTIFGQMDDYRHGCIEAEADWPAGKKEREKAEEK